MSKEHAYAYDAGYRDGSVHYELEHCPACKNVADLQEARDENANLRELVQDIWDWLAPTAISSATPLKGLHDRMHELGIEVDE